MSLKKVLVTGGAGFIGSVAVSMLLDLGLEVNVLDDLSTGHISNIDDRANFIFGSILSADALNSSLKNCDLVMHFAGKAIVGESMIMPEEYQRVNVEGSVNLFNSMQQNDVSRIVFSSSCATYGQPREIPISECAPTSPINPYGSSKLAVDQLLAGGLTKYISSVSLRYFNVAGAFRSRSGWLTESHEPETHLIPNVLSANPESPVKVFGTKWDTKDGTCIRDFVHVVDLVEAHIKAIDALQPQSNTVINLGSGRGYSVADVIQSASMILGKQVPYLNVDPRPGDPSALIADISRAKKILNWTPTASIDQMILDSHISRVQNHIS